MEVHFLEAKIPLSKTYAQTEEGIEKQPYPMVKQVSSHREDVETLEEFYAALKYHSRNDHCLLKGKLDRKLDFESRAGAHNALEPTQWICLDFDYLDDETAVEPLLQKMGLGDVSYIMQYGAGHEIDKKFSAHLFMLLEEPILPEQLKLWLMEQNLSLDAFERQISLSRSNAALRWPLDIAVAQNHMLIYIAPPKCEGFEDPVEQRMKIVDRNRPKVSLKAAVSDLEADVVEEKKHKKLTELRKKKGLPAKKFATKLMSGIEVLSKPGATMVTDQKEARGFMYLNLNGGDSWGYYHPVDNPEILFNFKGEPNYLTKELVPEYYKAYRKILRDIQQEEEGERQYLAFLDRQSDQYFRGVYDPDVTKLELYQTNSVKKVEDFLKQNNQWVGDYIEEWDYVFRFDDSRICSPEERFANRYRETELLKSARNLKPPKSFPPTVYKILNSVTGNNREAVSRLINWLAFIIQKRERSQTAWVFNGVQGTGKGLLVHKILAPILGPDVVQVKPMSSLDEPYNAYMEHCVLLMLDETKRDQVSRNQKARAKLYQAITDPVIPIRAMRTDHYMAKNYMNVIVASNHRDSIEIEKTDRRFNVGDFQNDRLMVTDEEINSLESELEDFTAVLANVNIDMHKVRTPMQSDSRDTMKTLSMNSIQTLLEAVNDGDLQALIDLVPTPKLSTDAVQTMTADHVRKVLREGEALAKRGERHILEREDIHAILTALGGDSIPDAPSKFTHMMRHYGIFFERYEVGDRLAIGTPVEWKVPEFGCDRVFGKEGKLRSVK